MGMRHGRFVRVRYLRSEGGGEVLEMIDGGTDGCPCLPPSSVTVMTAEYTRVLRTRSYRRPDVMVPSRPRGGWWVVDGTAVS